MDVPEEDVDALQRREDFERGGDGSDCRSRAREVAARVLASAHEVACCRLVGIRHTHRDELA